MIHLEKRTHVWLFQSHWFRYSLIWAFLWIHYNCKGSSPRMPWCGWGNAILSWTGMKTACFSDIFAQKGGAYTRVKSLFWGSLVTFLTNDLGTECPCSGIIREDLREGRCERVQDVIQWKTCTVQVYGEAPGYFLHLSIVRNMLPRRDPVRSTTQAQLPCQGPLVTMGTVSFPLPKKGPGRITKH